MRTIKFRGKAVLEEDDNVELTDRIVKHGDWVHGNLVFTDGTPYIVHWELVGVDVDYTVLHYWIPVDCVGQFTGLHDKNGVEIYEGDLIRELGLKETWTLSRRDEFSNRNHIVMWDEEELQWCGNLYEQSVLEIYEMDTRPLEFLCKKYTIEVIGNIHEEVSK